MENRNWMAPLAAAAGAGALGSVGALVRRPWHDELYTLELARRPVAAIVRALHVDSGPPGYYVLCRILHLGGADTVRALRLLSVAAVMVAAVLVVASCRDRKVRWAAAALMALHPLVLAAAADARPYALMMAMAAAVLFVLTREPAKTNTVALALLLGGACWIHSLGLILTAAVFATGLLLPDEARRRALLGALGGLILQLPWVPVMLGQPADSLQWMARGWHALPAWWRPLLPLTQAGPAALRTSFVDLASPPAALAAGGTLVWLGLAVLGLFTDRRAWAPAGIWVGSGALLVTATEFLRPVYAPDQAGKILLVFAVFVVATAAHKGRRALVAVVLLALLGGAVSCATIDSWKTEPPRPWEGATSILRHRAVPGDMIITTGWWYLELRHGLGPLGHRITWLTFPLETAHHPGWYDDATARAAARDLPVLARCTRQILASGHHVFLLRSPGLPSNRLLDAFAGETGLIPVASDAPYWELWEGSRH